VVDDEDEDDSVVEEAVDDDVGTNAFSSKKNRTLSPLPKK